VDATVPGEPVSRSEEAGALTALLKRLVDSALYHGTRVLTPRVSPRFARLASGRKVVSFSFDDFPRSAALAGAQVMESQNTRATYYVAMGLMTANGPGFTREDLQHVSDHGHELGCHSHSHLDLMTASRRTVEGDLDQNAQAFEAALPGKQLAHFAYPYGRLRPEQKAQLAGRFASMRSIFPGLHRGKVDLSLLKGNKLYSRGKHLDRALRLLDTLAGNGGWLILYSHDVSESPTEFGVTPKDLERLLRVTASVGAEIAPVGTVVASLLPA